MPSFQPPDDRQIIQLLRKINNIAVVGLSPNPARPSHGVARSLQEFGYRIFPVRPAVDEILGEKAYASLAEISEPIDLVDVFRAPQYIDEIVDACIELNLPAIWLQDGVINESAASRAQQAGIFVVMDRCIYRDYINLGLAHG